MFEDFQSFYASSSQSSCPSSSDVSCSFDSASSFGSGSTGSWETPPPSLLRLSPNSIKLEDMPSSTLTRSEQLDHSSCVSAMSPYDIVSDFSDHNLVFSASNVQSDRAMVDFNGFSVSRSESFGCFQSHDGLHLNTPALEMGLCSPVSGMEPSPRSIGFVVPSQTTFADSYDLNSPMPAPRLLQYQSPTSDYGQEFTMESTNFPLEYQDCKSTPDTPSRISTTCRPRSVSQQRIFEDALQEVQSDSAEVRQARRRAKRDESNDLCLPNNIRIQEAATKLCLWEGCGRKFKRQEHLKRHERTHTKTDLIPCPIPGCGKGFNRSDNLKSHIKLHDNPDKSQKRTPYHPGAQAIWKGMTRKPKRKIEAGSKMRDRRANARSRAIASRGVRQRVSTTARLERSRY